ncbi:hypothetical protein SEA_YEEZY_84 [Gordonia phage Yeezy]|uniref:Uncharacterized protein n=1 Tax=Gordonia phage Yeezy TaxID=1821565 RepID=A0A142K9P6_9CAUD|nr:hypothetical protein SEA_YEEZY_84 [Gordonia phage Yeezy]AMS02829.1 hypothetical protein SEA_YEEZY_84 [Gordonia phage Yeezy]
MQAIETILCWLGFHRHDERVYYDVNDNPLTIDKCDSCGRFWKVT